MSDLSLKQALDKIQTVSDRLKAARITHEVKSYRGDALSILAVVPGEYWEIDACDDGSIDFEIFKSQGQIKDAAALESMIREIESLDKQEGNLCP